MPPGADLVTAEELANICEDARAHPNREAFEQSCMILPALVGASSRFTFGA